VLRQEIAQQGDTMGHVTRRVRQEVQLDRDAEQGQDRQEGA
jgi:hypothetical protein